MISKGNDVNLARFLLLAVSEEVEFTNGRQPGTSARPNMKTRRFGIKNCLRGKPWSIAVIGVEPAVKYSFV